MNAVEDRQGIQIFGPVHLGSKSLQRLLLETAKDGERFDDPILDRSQRFLIRRGQDIESESPIICALFDERESAGSPEANPDSPKLPGKDVSKDRTRR